MNFKRLFSVLGVVAAFAFAGNAKASDDVGLYNKNDFKLHMVDFQGVDGSASNFSLRMSPEFSGTRDSNGFRQAVLRGGLSLKLTSWLTLGANGVVLDTFGTQDVRAEVQPDLHVSFGALQVDDRNRVAYRALDKADGNRWRYDNELKLSLDSKDCHFVPFVSDEIFVNTDQRGLDQNRATVGVGYKFTDNSRVDLGYMVRSVEDTTNTWHQTHFVLVGLNTF